MIIDALISTGYLTTDTAQDFLEKLENQGLTVYKKKVFANGRRPNSSEPVTPELKKAIREYFEANPDVTQQQIANRFNVNSGRVAEALQMYLVRN